MYVEDRDFKGEGKEGDGAEEERPEGEPAPPAEDEREADEQSEDSFPASDPPAW